jgi:hypothetical protein
VPKMFPNDTPACVPKHVSNKENIHSRRL